MISLAYLYIFLQSNILEIPIYWLCFRKKLSFKSTAISVTAINSLTHPIVFFVFMNFHQSYLQNILLAEAFAISTEALFFSRVLKLSWPSAIFASVLANLISWQLAPMLTYLLFI